MDAHKFNPLSMSVLCGTCYKPKLHDLHIADLDSNDIKPNQEIARTRNDDTILGPEFTLVDGIEVPWNAKRLDNCQPSIQNVEVSPHVEANGQLSFTERVAKLDKTVSSTNEPNCYGHVCPVCADHWTHTYKCWPDPKVKEVMHCPKCFGQASVEIHRPNNIEELLKESLSVEGVRRIKEVMIEHEAFVVLEATKSGDYQVWFDNHIANLRQQLREINAKISAAQTGKLKCQKEEDSKLTVEEIEAHKRAAARQKKAKEVKAADTKTDDKKAWNELLKGLIRMGNSMDEASEQLTAMYTKKGKVIPS